MIPAAVAAASLRPVPVSLASVCALVIAVGLPVDQFVRFGQVVVDVIVWGVFLGAVRSADRPGRVLLLACLLFATLGEVFLSLVWGLYDYRLGNLPLFVPPGHALLLCLGLFVARHVGARAAWLVPALALPAVLAMAWLHSDTFGLVLFVAFALAMALANGRARALYAVMFVLSLLLELYGTWLGNWRWRAEAPWLGLPTCNPPLAAGTFYCLLDVLVVATLRRFARA